MINAIRKESADQAELLNLSYPEHLWMEKEIKSVANVARSDVESFAIAARIPIRPEFSEFDLSDANLALQELKQQKIRGAKVLKNRRLSRLFLQRITAILFGCFEITNAIRFLRCVFRIQCRS